MKYFKYAATAIFSLLGCYLIYCFIRDGIYTLGIFIAVAVIFSICAVIKNSLASWRWLVPGLVMALLFTVYPIFYTIYLSFTNMSGGHLLTQTQAVQRISQETYIPDDESPWAWTAYRKGNNYLILLEHEGDYFKATPGDLPEPFNVPASGIPSAIDGYEQMNRVVTLRNLPQLSQIDFGRSPNIIKILSMQEAAVQLPAYSYSENSDTFTDNRSGEIYRAVRGTYTSETGKALIPGFMVNIGTNNYTRFLGNRGYLNPMFGIFIWNICFSLFSVLISFAIGMLIALIFEDLKFKRIIRALLIIPYPIPVLVSIMVWRALLNENMGLVTSVISGIFGFSPQFFTNVGWTRFALILINVYLSYPYFYILTSGALKSIPHELFEASAIDGAGPITTIRKIILPMVMRILAPLLIASFCFNFNNFTLVWGFNAGLPAMADTAVPMGYTDLLISFIYRLGFSSSNAADYGFIAAITVMLFIVVALMVVVQTWNTKTIKESK